MTRPTVLSLFALPAIGVAMWGAGARHLIAQAPAGPAQSGARPARADVVTEPRAPAGVKEGGTWVPPMPTVVRR